MTLLFLILGLALLLAGGTALVHGASCVASGYGVSPLIVGLTIVAIGTSMPELVVNIVGVLRHETALAFGNVVGSNIANLGLVLALAALVKPISIQGQIVRRELPLLLLGTSIFLVMTLDQFLLGTPAILTRSEGLVLLLLFGIFVYISVCEVRAGREDVLVESARLATDGTGGEKKASVRAYWLFILAGIAALGIGGHLTIVSASELSKVMGLPPVVVGMIVVAVGTSSPELVTSVIAAWKNQSDLCLGNVIGSNVFNLLFVLPISALILPIPIPAGGVGDTLVSIGFAAILLPVFYFGRAYMNRMIGAAMLIVYFFYMLQRSLF